MASTDPISCSDRDEITRQTLLMRVRSKDDRDAWDEFVNLYTPRIFQWCRRYQLQDSDAADVTQEVLLKVLRAIRDFQYDSSRGSFRGWLKTVTANAVRDAISSSRRAIRGAGDTATRESLENLLDERALAALSDEIELCHRLELVAAAEQVVRRRVQAHTWEAYRMTAVEQRKPAEVARLLGMPVSEVYVAKSRVIKLLRAAVEEP